MKVGGQRLLNRNWDRIGVRYLGIISILYHLYAAQFGAPEVLKYRSTHVALYLALTFLLYNYNKSLSNEKNIPWHDYLLAGLAILPTIYIFINYERFTTRYPYVSPLHAMDWVFAILAIILTFEACRRSIGYPLPILFIIFTTHALFGGNLPGPFGQANISLRRLVDHLFMTTSGLFGLVTGMSATFIVLFVLFGAVFEDARGGQLFMDIATALMGKTRGGPAKTGVIASGLFGSISGSTVSNVYATGSITIPLMKKVGFKPAVAGAIEAVASSSGQLVPPIMGAAAFMMADFLNIPYLQVAAGAALPAFLFLFSLYMMVHFQSKKSNLAPMEMSMVSEARKNIWQGLHLVFPIITIVYLLSRRHTPFFSAYWGVVTAIIFAQLRPYSRMNFKKILDTLEKSARRLAPIAVALFIANLVVAVIELSGLGLRFTSILLEMSGGSLPLTLFLIMLSSIILGMGLPTTAAYLIVSIFAAPTLVELGVYPLAAHIFVFYYSILSAITPPVALAAYAAATIAEAPMQKTAMQAVKIGATVFIMPWVIIYNPDLVQYGSDWWSNIQTIITAVMGVIPFTSGIQGLLFKKSNIVERGLGLVSGILLFISGGVTDLIGLLLFALLGIYQLYGKVSIKKIRTS